MSGSAFGRLRCLQRLGTGLMPCLFALLCFSFVTTSTANSSNSTKMLVYNLTLCELNVTGFTDKFDYVVETYVVFPALTHFLSLKFLTFSHLCDTLILGTVAGLGFWQSRYCLSVAYACAACVGFLYFAVHAVRNCMAWRYACTNRTNFILDSKGRVHPSRSSVIVVKNGQALTSSGPVDLKTVVLDGVKATLKTTALAEQWQTTR
uniref:GP5 n=1 Tax=Bamboo rat arterivirus TaxID=3038165 RepID=A0AAT9TZJ7_9NIDO|nr:GP5 [Bamboo rat arterivirus]WFG95407.1 GP5 [Arteriviridae sp.]